MIEYDEASYLRKVARDIWSELPLWVLANVVFALSCLPFIALVVLGAGTAALWALPFTALPVLGAVFYPAGRMARSLAAGPRHLFLGLKRGYWSVAMLSIPLALLGQMVVSTAQMARTRPDQSWLIFPWVVQLIVLLVALMIYQYALCLTVVCRGRLRSTLATAAALAVAQPVASIGLLGVAALIGVLGVWIGPASLVALPVVWVVFVANWTILARQRLLERYGRTDDICDPD